MKLRSLIKCFLIYLFLSINLVAAQSSGCNQLKVSGAVGWYPLLMKSDYDNGYRGVGYDLAVEIARELKIPLIFKVLPWKRALRQLELGTLDIILGLYKTKPRSIKYLFSPVLINNEIKVFVLKEKIFELNSYENLIGRRGDMPNGGSFGDAFDDFAHQHLQLSKMRGKKEKIKRLLRGVSDYFVSDYFDAMRLLDTEKLTQRIVALPYIIASNPVHFAISRNSACTVQAQRVFALLNRFKKDGTLAEIIKRYDFVNPN